MDKFFTFVLYLLWSFSIIGILIITFRNFEDADLNAIVGVLFFFTLINTFFASKRR